MPVTPLDYARPGGSHLPSRIRLRHALGVMLLLTVVALWPTTQLFVLSARQGFKWVWCDTGIQAGGSLIFNRTGVFAGAYAWRMKWQPGKPVSPFSGPERERWFQTYGTRTLVRGHRESWTQFTVQRCNADGSPQLQVSIFGLRFGRYSDDSVARDIWHHTTATHAKDAVQLALPGWLIALISVGAGVALWRRMRGRKSLFLAAKLKNRGRKSGRAEVCKLLTGRTPPHGARVSRINRRWPRAPGQSSASGAGDHLVTT